MQFGLSMFITDETIAPAELAAPAEERGFDSLFVPEHTHIPASCEAAGRAATSCRASTRTRSTRSSALSAAAATTERLRVGTGIALIVERDPITLAKEVATLDHLSGGRFELGIGAGWNIEEMREPRHRPVPALRASCASASLAMTRDLDE